MNDDFMLAPLKRKKVVREKKVEASRKALVRAQGGMSLKFVSPGLAGVPDQIELYGVATMMELTGFTHEACVALLATAIQFTEAKRPGGVPRPEQLRRHAELRALGFTVNVIDQP
jgi:hypothetical protein